MMLRRLTVPCSYVLDFIYKDEWMDNYNYDGFAQKSEKGKSESHFFVVLVACFHHSVEIICSLERDRMSQKALNPYCLH